MQYGNQDHGTEPKPQDDHLTAIAVNKHPSEISDARTVTLAKQLREELYQVLVG